MNKSVIKYICYRLREWAKWRVYDNLPNIGYPSMSVEGRLMTYGTASGKDKTSQRSHRPHPAAEQIEDLLQEMRYYHAIEMKIISIEYLRSGTQEEKSRRMRMSASQYKTYLNLARAWLAGRLSKETVVHLEKKE
ncbi:MAG: hypothetical protein V3T17_05130 [Pseudomonadales bacterium]